MRKSLKMAVSALLAFSLCACGSNASTQPASNAEAADDAQETAADPEKALEGIELDEPGEEKYDPNVENIDLTLEGGSIRFDHVEKANEGLTDSDNAYIFVFDFTNEQDIPSQAQSVFYLQFFQNGTELTNNLSYNSKGGDQYELVGAFFDSAMKGGTVTFGKIVEPKDDSPVTIMVSPNGAAMEENYQMMEVPLVEGSDGDSKGDAEEKAAEVSAEDVDAELQGTWDMGKDGQWTFDQGNVTFDVGATTISGTYEIDTDRSVVAMSLEATDGIVKAILPFEYDGKTLKVFKNTEKAEQLAKL